jgi:outer membrane protein OmpA-like peptidoglycan-associated protein
MAVSKLRFLLCCSFFLFSSIAHGQDLYYVVIGSFADEFNAKKFTGYVRSQRYDASYDLHTGRKLFYVYVVKTSDKEQSYAKVRQLQSESEFKDAWVFNGILASDKNPVVVVVPEPEKIETPITESPSPDTATAQITITDSVSKEVPVVTAAPESTNTIPVFDPKMIVKGKLFRFSIQGPSGENIPGNVHHVDFARGRDIATFNSGEYIDMLPPSRNSGPMTIVCAIFGYKEIVQTIDYDRPGESAGVALDENNAWVISYKLEPMTTGDVSVMYHVAFYKDAVIMLPPSKSELDQLVYMMTTNPEYRIKIHGHCNGNNSRRIIALGAEQNHFDMKGSNEVKGSAKDLSRLRAEAVQTYLATHGIDKSRSEIYAWGGLNMLVSENSTSAKLNDRIEIEILKN